MLIQNNNWQISKGLNQLLTGVMNSQMYSNINLIRKCLNKNSKFKFWGELKDQELMEIKQ